MNTFAQKISDTLLAHRFVFEWLNHEDLVAKALASAEEYVIAILAERELSPEDKALMKDVALSAPDIFDPDEFLSERILDYDEKVDACFDEWLEQFQKNL